MADELLAVIFVAAAAVSLATGWQLVSRLAQIGARIGLSETLLGMLAAMAADASEITASVTALAGHHSRIGAGRMQPLRGRHAIRYWLAITT